MCLIVFYIFIQSYDCKNKLYYLFIYVNLFQNSQSEIGKRGNLLTAASDYACALVALADEGVLSDAEHSVRQLRDLFTELEDRLAQRKTVLEVGAHCGCS